MPFCSDCGTKIDDDARFCIKCGKPVDLKKNTVQQVKIQPESAKRNVNFEGELRKCPNCGDPIDAFEYICDKCGYNFTTNRNSTSQERLAAQLSAIDIEMQNAINKNKKKDYWEIRNISEGYKQQKATCINSFSVANSVEEIVSFMMYASGNIDMTCLATSIENNTYDKGDHQIAEAWIGKMDQMYHVAKVSFPSSPMFAQIEHVYITKKREISKTRTKRIITNPMFACVLILIGCIAGLFIITEGGERKLEKQVEQIETYIAEENYDAALTVAYAMDDNYSDSWSETRSNLISRILTLQNGEAAENNEGLVQFPTEKLEGKQASDVVAILESAGFTNVKQEKANSDLLTGWVDALTETKGEVEEITVNGSNNYSKGEWMEPDTPIIVRHW